MSSDQGRIFGWGLVGPRLAGGVGDGEDVGVSHAVFGDFLADDGPSILPPRWRKRFFVERASP